MAIPSPPASMAITGKIPRFEMKYKRAQDQRQFEHALADVEAQGPSFLALRIASRWTPPSPEFRGPRARSEPHVLLYSASNWSDPGGTRGDQGAEFPSERRIRLAKLLRLVERPLVARLGLGDDGRGVGPVGRNRNRGQAGGHQRRKQAYPSSPVIAFELLFTANFDFRHCPILCDDSGLTAPFGRGSVRPHSTS